MMSAFLRYCCLRPKAYSWRTVFYDSWDNRDLKAPLVLASVYAALSSISFFAYWCDKEAAKRGRPRVRESNLLLAGLAGGWPGALIAQQVFRHKTRKTSFQVAFWITVALNAACLAFIWLKWL